MRTVHSSNLYEISTAEPIQQDKMLHYSKITKHMKNYKCIFRDNFEILSQNIINNT